MLKDLPRSLSGRVFPTMANALKEAFVRGLERARLNYLGDSEVAQVTPQEDFLINLRLQDLRHEATCRFATKLPNFIEMASVTGNREMNMLSDTTTSQRRAGSEAGLIAPLRVWLLLRRRPFAFDLTSRLHVT
ncbi:hypothetical protein [Pseudomonas syringae]|uniref:hypothetical protein n=1 Tax=Pseudomonas syringae TaxID=317 RepID=UPI0004923667|nr:hypothetical protein [Pseudomonas syringae]